MPYRNMKPEMQDLIRRSLAFLLTVIILLLVRSILVHLPGMGTSFSKYHFTIAQFAGAAVSAAIMIVMFYFSKEITGKLGALMPYFPEGSQLIHNGVLFIIILTGYSAFNRLVTPLLFAIHIGWLYQVVFLCLCAYPVYRMVTALIGSKGELPLPDIQTSGPHFGSRVTAAQFCAVCGKELPGRTNSCLKCGTVLRPGAKFCTSCGVMAEAPSEDTECRNSEEQTE